MNAGPLAGIPAVPKDPLEVAMQQWTDEAAPLTSVFCWTFNDVEYIRQSVDSILQQETDFPVEIVVHDDASTDGTSEIIRRYGLKHPNLFRNILQHENQFSKGNCLLAPLFSMTRGDFIALSHGDDYWTDPTKLQRQVDLLRSRPEASGCIHRADGRFEGSGELVPGHFGPEAIQDAYSIDDLLHKGNFVPTSSIVFRKSALFPISPWFSRVPHGDFALLCAAAAAGPLLYLDRSMSVYRKHGAGMHTCLPTALQILNAIETLHIIGENLQVTDRKSFKEGLGFRRQQMRDLVEGSQRETACLHERVAELEGILLEMRSSRTFRTLRGFASWQDSIRRLLGRV